VRKHYHVERCSPGLFNTVEEVYDHTLDTVTCTTDCKSKLWTASIGTAKFVTCGVWELFTETMHHGSCVASIVGSLTWLHRGRLHTHRQNRSRVRMQSK